MRRAFTIIELIFTMVILGIVASIASGLIAKTYIGYNRANAINRANMQVELAITQIANRLSYAIGGTVVKRQSANNTNLAAIDVAPENYNVLEWIGWDKDGFNASRDATTSRKPGWSGFCDIKASSVNQIVTPGSDLSFANTVLRKLSAGLARFDNTKKDVAIFFPGNYDYTNVGYNGNASGVRIISSFTAPNKLNLIAQAHGRITEHYKLAWSAYAVVPVDINATGDDTFNLQLRYNFRPWKGKDYNSATGVKKHILAKHITVFKTYATQNRVHIKLCAKERIGLDKNSTISVCKEKVVFK